MSSIAAMQEAIKATLYHCSYTDKKPNHKFCPKGEMVLVKGEMKPNWCFYNRAKAVKQKPESHEKCP